MEREISVGSMKNLFSIRYAIIVLLVQSGVLIPIVHKSGVGVKWGHQYPENGYFRIRGLQNVVWMHIQDEHGIIINEYVTTKSGKQINLVQELQKYYWYIDWTSNTPKCSKLNNRSIWRCIGSIISYDDINHCMPGWLEVHHKWLRWCNTQETMSVICEQKHRYFHTCLSNRKSHKNGVAINNVEQMERWLNTVNDKNNYFKNIPM